MKYRADIDGVRAIAVTGVIMAHAGLGGVHGGFLGVDIFFVISGYLITTILRNDLDAGRYTLRGFYERRARRILPALLLVTACCVPFALWLMLPDFLQNFGQSVVATLLFSNNILLAATSGYWELESGFKPLLHTWSLGVEEQFYVVFPLCLAAIWRFGRKAQITAIALALVISFGIAEHGWRTYPEASFYLPTSRAWELMAGCLVAYVERKARSSDHVIAPIALLAMVLPLFLFDEHTPSPSIYSAIPVLGTAAIILCNRPETLVYKLLALRPVVFVGLISYSAYLWHQPLFAFARVASLTPPSFLEIILLTLATYVLATASWWGVERPFRDRARITLRRFLPAAALGTAALVACGLVVHLKQGFPQWTFPNIDRAGDVYISYNERIRGYSRTAFPENGRANVLLMGDSFARDVGNVLIEGGALTDKNLVYLYRDPDCGEEARDPPGTMALFHQADAIVVSLGDHTMPCVEAMNRRLAARTAMPVVFFGSKRWGSNINPFARVPMERRASTFAEFPADDRADNDAIARALPAGSFVDMARLLGPDGRRLRFFDDNGNPLTPDHLHLTRYGAVFVARKLDATKPLAWRRITEAQPHPRAR